MLRTTCPLPLPTTHTYMCNAPTGELAFPGNWGEEVIKKRFQFLKSGLQNKSTTIFTLQLLSFLQPFCTDILGMNQAAKTNDPYFLGGEQVEKITKGCTELEPHKDKDR